MRKRTSHHVALSQAGVGDEERAGDAELGTGIGQFFDPPVAEADCRRIVPVAEQCPAHVTVHTLSSAFTGGRLTNFWEEELFAFFFATRIGQQCLGRIVNADKK